MTPFETAMAVIAAVPLAFIVLTTMQITFLVTTVVHELGHWLAAKLFGAYAPVFSLAAVDAEYRVVGTVFGTQFRVGLKLLPNLARRRWHDLYARSGPDAYVTVVMDAVAPEVLKKIEQDSGVPAPREVITAPLWKHFCVWSAGVLANLMLCAVAFKFATWLFPYAFAAGLIPKAVLMYLVFASALLSLINFLTGVSQLLPMPGSDGSHLMRLWKTRKR